MVERDAAPTGPLPKAVLLLDELAEFGEKSAQELAKSLQEPRSSVYRLLAHLQWLGLVEAGHRRGAYRLGLKLLRYGRAVSDQLDERRASLPIMERLHRETGQTVALVVRHARNAVIIERIDGLWVQPRARPVGAVIPLHAGSGPRVLLAYSPRESWGEYLAGPLERFYPQTPTSPVALLTELERIRAVGYAVSEEGFVDGIATISAPIFDFTGSVRAATGVSGLRSSILEQNKEANIVRVLAATAEISAALGYEPSRTSVPAKQLPTVAH